MSKTWKVHTWTRQPKTSRTAENPQKAIDRLRDREARQEISEALRTPQEAACK